MATTAPFDEFFQAQLDKLRELAGGFLCIYDENDIMLCYWQIGDPAFSYAGERRLKWNFVNLKTTVQNDGRPAWGGFFAGERLIRRYSDIEKFLPYDLTWGCTITLTGADLELS